MAFYFLVIIKLEAEAVLVVGAGLPLEEGGVVEVLGGKDEAPLAEELEAVNSAPTLELDEAPATASTGSTCTPRIVCRMIFLLPSPGAMDDELINSLESLLPDHLPTMKVDSFGLFV